MTTASKKETPAAAKPVARKPKAAGAAAAPTAVSAAASSSRRADKDLPLIEDIRLLGRILGDVIREQEGQAAFDLTEQVRQLSVAYRRNDDRDAEK